LPDFSACCGAVREGVRADASMEASVAAACAVRLFSGCFPELVVDLEGWALAKVSNS
jgi:hypothetical protein